MDAAAIDAILRDTGPWKEEMQVCLDALGAKGALTIKEVNAQLALAHKKMYHEAPGFYANEMWPVLWGIKSTK